MNHPIAPATLVVEGSPPSPITKETAVKGVLTISGTAYPCTIKGHGNWTWGQPKQPYNIKLDTAAGLLGMPADKNWVLLANVSDHSFVNTALAMTLGKPLFEWTPGYGFIDLTLNGTYNGIYQLMEKVELDNNRINKPKVGTATTGAGLTGTYLMEINDQGHQPTFKTQHGVSIIWDDPNMAPAVPQQQTYIQNWIQTFEDALFAPDAFTRTSNKYWDMIDGTSFATWYLIEELASNQDSDFSGSCKLYKTRDGNTPGKLFMGPLWDFDISFGNTVNYSHDANKMYTRVPKSVWLVRMFQDPTFIEKVKEVWKVLKTTMGPNGSVLITWINTITRNLGNSMVKDRLRWNYNYHPINGWSYTAINYAVYPEKQTWIKDRIQYLDQNYGGT